jgi:thiosulfate reductase cytochrome b subunit
MPEPSTAPRPRQPLLVRATHWLNLALLVAMAGSGLRILAAFPQLGEVGAPFRWYPLQGASPPELLTLGGWLAGARGLHFAFAWLIVLNGLVHAGWLLASGTWRERLFLPRRDAHHAWQTLLHDFRLRRAPPPPSGLYNGMQRLAYTLVLLLAPLALASGLALLEPVQLAPLTALLGGFQAARAIHLGVLAALALFALVHVVQVVLHPRTLLDMTAGGRRGEAP